MVLFVFSYQFVFKIRLYSIEAMEIVRMGRGGDNDPGLHPWEAMVLEVLNFLIPILQYFM
jgi:hypothetical protein